MTRFLEIIFRDLEQSAIVNYKLRTNESLLIDLRELLSSSAPSSTLACLQLDRRRARWNLLTCLVNLLFCEPVVIELNLTLPKSDELGLPRPEFFPVDFLPFISVLFIYFEF